MDNGYDLFVLLFLLLQERERASEVEMTMERLPLPPLSLVILKYNARRDHVAWNYMHVGTVDVRPGFKTG
jgi:hypothetical protein